MMRFKSAISAVLIFISTLPLTSAQAGVEFFRNTCVATVKNFAALETHLLVLGMTETNDMPSRVLYHPTNTRTWTSYAFPGRPGDGFVQLAIGSDAQPFDVCSHASRPGENAADALATLQKLYRPVDGSVRREPDFIYGGRETWAATIDDEEVLLRVDWAPLHDLSKGTSVLNLIKPRQHSIGANEPGYQNSGTVHLAQQLQEDRQ
jgi:hypothetical protein